MKAVYPITITQGTKFFVVFVPDFNINTQGKDITEAIEMARDAIGITGIDFEDDKKAIPLPSQLADIRKENESDIITLVDVDFTEYRRKNDLRTVKKNCTVPSWLAHEAEKAGVNFSALLQSALKHELKLQ
ncbi:HicB family protein [Clostridia bacterium]|nr:HicB family protein [Clostridia bacterium]